MSKPGAQSIDELKAVLRQNFKEQFTFYFSNMFESQPIDVNESDFLIRLGVSSVDELFENYFQKMKQGYSEKMLLLLPANKQKKFGENMARSLGGFIWTKELGPLISDQKNVPLDYLDKAVTSLETDFYNHVSPIEIHANVLNNIVKESEIKLNEREMLGIAHFDYTSIIAKATFKLAPKIKFKNGALEGALPHAVKDSLNVVIARNQQSFPEPKAYFRAYSIAVSALLSEFAKAGEPFATTRKDRDGKGQILDGIAIKAAAEFAGKFLLNKDVLSMTPEKLQLYAQGLGKQLTSDKSLKEKYSTGFQAVSKSPESVLECTSELVNRLDNFNVINRVESSLANKLKENAPNKTGTVEPQTKVLQMLFADLISQDKTKPVDINKAINIVHDQVIKAKMMSKDKFWEVLHSISIPGVSLIALPPVPQANEEVKITVGELPPTPLAQEERETDPLPPTPSPFSEALSTDSLPKSVSSTSASVSTSSSVTSSSAQERRVEPLTRLRTLSSKEDSKEKQKDKAKESERQVFIGKHRPK